MQKTTVLDSISMLSSASLASDLGFMQYCIAFSLHLVTLNLWHMRLACEDLSISHIQSQVQARSMRGASGQELLRDKKIDL